MAINERMTEGRGRAAPWHEPAALTLDADGMICDCNETGEQLFEYACGELARRHVSTLFPQLSAVDLFENGQVNPRLGFMCRCGHAFQARNRHGITFPSNLSFITLNHAGTSMLRLIVQPTLHGAA